MTNNENPFLEDGSTKSKRDIITDFLQTIVLALAFSLILYLVFLVPSIVDGPSMEPNFNDKELLFANKTVQWLGESGLGDKYDYDYTRGEVIIFESGDANLIKRIIATEGDQVMFADSEVYINGNRLEEDYIPETYETVLPLGSRAMLQEGETVTVPEGHYFVMGDHRPVSKDSRFSDVGFVPREKIKGRVFLRYWPINKFQIIRPGEYTEVIET